MAENSGVGMTSDRTRLRMVKRLEEAGIKNPAVLSALERVPRHKFIDEALDSRAYELMSLPIGYGQTISHPFIVGRLCEHIFQELPLQRVLEIGSGCGYQAAVLSQISNEVFSVERNINLLSEARIRLRKMGYRNVHLRHADGYSGLKKMAPFDAIIVTAAAEFVPDILISQLKDGASLVMPVGTDSQELIKIKRNGDNTDKESHEKVKFVPLLKGLS